MTFTCRDGRLTGHGEPIEDAVRAVASSEKVVAVGVNCTAPEFVDELLGRIAAVSDLPLVAYPNAGRSYDAVTKTWSGEMSSCTFAGATLVGGCCGWGPAAIAVGPRVGCGVVVLRTAAPRRECPGARLAEPRWRAAA